MKQRIYKLAILFFTVAMLASVQVRANESHRPDHSQNEGDKKNNNHSDKNLPINTAIVALLIAGIGIGIISIKKVRSVATKGI